MNQEALLAIMQLMGSLITTPGLDEQTKSVAEDILYRSLQIQQENIKVIHASVVSKLTL